MSLETLITEEPTPAPSIFDSIVSSIKAEDETFAIRLLTGHVLHFRHVLGRDAFLQVGAAARKFADEVNSKNAPAPLMPYMGASRETRIWCYTMGMLNTDGGGELGFLQIQHHGALVFEHLLEQFKAAMAHISNGMETGAIDAAKKESSDLSSGETGS